MKTPAFDLKMTDIQSLSLALRWDTTWVDQDSGACLSRRVSTSRMTRQQSSGLKIIPVKWSGDHLNLRKTCWTSNKEVGTSPLTLLPNCPTTVSCFLYSNPTPNTLWSGLGSEHRWRLHWQRQRGILRTVLGEGGKRPSWKTVSFEIVMQCKISLSLS